MILQDILVKFNNLKGGWLVLDLIVFMGCSVYVLMLSFF